MAFIGEKTWAWWLWKMKLCTEANQTLIFKRFQKNFVHRRPIYGANISQIFPFPESQENLEVIFFIKLWTRPKYFMHILPSACWNCYSFRSCCCLNSTAFQIHVKSERISQIYNICINILGKWGWRETFIKDSFSMEIDP